MTAARNAPALVGDDGPDSYGSTDGRYDAYQPSKPVGYTLYILKPGDTIYDIAAARLGSSDRWGQIARLNGIADGTQYTLPVGLKIKLPPK